MSGAQVSYIGAFRQGQRSTECLVERARRRRRELIGTRKIWIVEIETQVQGVAQHRFLEPPRVADLLARIGADATLIGLRVEEVPGRKCLTMAAAAE